ncbi:MAG: YdcF family protein [Acidobacteria bacterium]|nr:YdcF family protein [Acidobacteriota bacterium]MBS1866448.1 YdcF family protein [Acidobacteriota bacterium]
MRKLKMTPRRLSKKQNGSARTWLIAGTLLLCLCTVIFLRIGNWLVQEDELQKCRAVVVLTGGMPYRALQAAEIYKAGWAPEVWLTRPAEPKESMDKLGVPFDGEEELSKRVLLKQGVPEKAIRILSPAIVNTADEMNVIADALQNGKGAAAIVVTSKAHTRRVHALWNKLEAGRAKVVVRAVATDSFDASHWWRSTSDALDVVREVLGLFNVWAGLPLKPAK